MSKKLIFLFLTLTLIFSQGSSLFAQGEAAPPVNQVVLLDDFNDGTASNLLGGNTQGDEEFPGGCIPAFVEDKLKIYGGTGRSLELDYDVTIANSFSFYWTKTGANLDASGASSPLDLSKYKYLSFWVRSNEADPRFAVELHQDVDGNDLFVLGKDIVARASSATYIKSQDVDRWRKVVIPFTDFRQINDWTKILEIVFVFENKNKSKKGTLLLDDVLFGSAEILEGKTVALLEKGKLFDGLKFNGKTTGGGDLKIKSKAKVELSLKEVPLQLETVRFEISKDNGASWMLVKNFYEQNPQGLYKWDWKVSKEEKTGNGLFRVIAGDLTGDTVEIYGPVKVQIS